MKGVRQEKTNSVESVALSLSERRTERKTRKGKGKDKKE